MLLQETCNTPFKSDMTISLLQLSHGIKSLEEKLLKSTFQKTIIRRFQNGFLILLLWGQEEILLFLYQKNLKILLGERQEDNVLGFFYSILYTALLPFLTQNLFNCLSLRDISGRKFSLASTRTEKEKKANFLFVLKYSSIIAG